MFKVLLFSFKKTRILNKIAKEYKPTPFNVEEWSKLIMSHELFGGKGTKGNQLENELLELLKTDKHTIDILNIHNRDFKDLKKIINKIGDIDGNRIINGHYLPISAIAFLQPLNEK